MAEISGNDWLKLLERSGLLDAEQFEKAKAAVADGETLPKDAATLAERFVRTGYITRFQADQLLAGRYKGFFLGKYRIQALLGTGGMGRVYLAEHILMRRQVALKVLPKGKGTDPAALARFHREARAVAALKHPNIVQAYDMDNEGDLHYMVMEVVVGMSAQDYVKQQGRLPFGQAADFILQAARGLDHAFHAGIVHRDIKPGNLLIDRQGVIKLLDLGLAVIFEEKEHNPLTLAFDENVLGTADYLSPEQALDSHNVDIRADIYSLGCTLYCLLTGKSPFPEGSVAQKLLSHQNREPQPIAELAPDVPEALAAVVRKMTMKKPEDRYQTPQEVVDALAPFAEPVPDPFIDSPLSDPLSIPLSPRPSHSASYSKPTSGPKSPTSSSQTSPSSSVPTSPAPAPRKEPASVAAPPASSASVPVAKKAAVKKAAVAVAKAAASDDSADFLRSLANQPISKPSSHVAAAKVDVEKKPPFVLPKMPPKFLAIAGAGVAAVVILGATGWWFFSRRASSGAHAPAVVNIDSPPASNAAAVGDVVVSKEKDVEGAHDSIDAALYETKKGQRVVIQPNPAGPWEIPYTVRISPDAIDGMAGVTLSGADSGVVVQLPAAADGPIFVVDRTSGFSIKNLTLDGGGKPGPLVVVTGPDVAGVTLENVTLRNFQGVGVEINGADGSQNRPVVLRGLTFKSAKPDAIAVAILGEAARRSKNVQIIDCKFEGPLAGGISLAQPASVLVQDCKFDKLPWALRLSAANADYKQVSLLGGEFQDVKERIASDVGPAAVSQVKVDPPSATKNKASTKK